MDRIRRVGISVLFIRWNVRLIMLRNWYRPQGYLDWLVGKLQYLGDGYRFVLRCGLIVVGAGGETTG